MTKLWKRALGVSHWLLVEGKSIRYGEGGGRGACGGGEGGASMIIRPKNGSRSVPNVLLSCTLNDSLASFVMRMLTNELCPLMLSHPCFR